MTDAGKRSFVVQMFTSPLALATFVVFALVIFGLYVCSARFARRSAEMRLSAAAEDVVGELDGCVGRQLAYVGKTICERYGSPERMKDVDMKSVMAAYGLDELNAIDARGIIVASNLPIVGDDQWQKANPRKFNTALLTERRGIYTQCFRASADEPNVWYKYVGVAFPPPAEGYLQLGFCRARMRDSFDYTLRELASAWHIGERGFYVISKTLNGEILSTLDESLSGKTLSDVGFNILLARGMSNVERRDPVSQDFLGFAELRFFEAEFAGIPCLCTSGVVNQFHRYVAAIPLAEIYGPVRRLVLLTAVLLFLALVCTDAFLLRLSTLVAKLRQFIRVDKERRQADLALAQTIQLSSLPVAFPDEADFKIFALMKPAREVGGDFYDFLELPSGRVLFLIADVSGKGVPAALFMMRARTMLRAAVWADPGDLAEAVRRANDALAEKNEAEMFVTAWVGIYDRASHEVVFVNAGHNPPLVKRADGTVEWLRVRGGLALAAMGGCTYRQSTTVLRPGDSIFLYTDGVTEAMDAAGRQYGDARLAQTLAANGDGLFVLDINRDVAAFVGDAEPFDDITMLALDVKRT